MSFLTKHFRQRATFWESTGVNSSGDPSFATPKTIQVRWEERQTVFTNAAGEEASAGAVIFVGEDMKAGDFLFLGVSIVADPTTVSNAREIQGWSKIPQLTGAMFERSAFLSTRG